MDASVLSKTCPLTGLHNMSPSRRRGFLLSRIHSCRLQAISGLTAYAYANQQMVCYQHYDGAISDRITHLCKAHVRLRELRPISSPKCLPAGLFPTLRHHVLLQENAGSYHNSMTIEPPSVQKEARERGLPLL